MVRELAHRAAEGNRTVFVDWAVSLQFRGVRRQAGNTFVIQVLRRERGFWPSHPEPGSQNPERVMRQYEETQGARLTTALASAISPASQREADAGLCR